VVSRGQLLVLGMKDNAMQYRVRRGGPWQDVVPGVYVAATGVPSLSQKEMAALLYAGPGSLITGPMALMHHWREPAKVAEMIRGALNRGLTRPPLPIRTIPCPGSIQWMSLST